MDITVKQNLQGAISTTQISNGNVVNNPQSSVSGGINVGVATPDYYDGSYEIEPKKDDQTLLTTKKTMRDDLKIKAVPYAVTSNSANGTTVTIGG